MKTNVGNKERIARVIAGLTILKSSKSKKMKLFALAPLISGATGHCPCYSKLGINTAKSAADSKKHAKAQSKDHAKDSADDKSTVIDSVMQTAETLKETVQEKAATLKETAQEKIEELADAKKADHADKAEKSEQSEKKEA